MDTKMKHYEKLIQQRLRDIFGITKTTKRNEFKIKMDKSR